MQNNNKSRYSGRLNLKVINYITDTVGWKEVEKTVDIIKTKRKFYTNESQFYNTDEKNCFRVFTL